MTASPHKPRIERPPLRKTRPELGQRGRQRAHRFLEAAVDVFLEKGYQNARLSDIVARSGGSYATLYRAYGDKEGLLRAIMEESICALDEALDELAASALPPAQALPIAAGHMVAEMLMPRHIVTNRIVIGEGMYFPELRDWFLEHGIVPVQRALTAYFEREKNSGRLRLESPELAGDSFLILVFGSVIIRSVPGMIDIVDTPQEQAKARASVEMFLRGLLP